MIPATVRLDTHYCGDTWNGLSIGPVQYNVGTILDPILESPPYRVVSCRSQFRDSSGTLGYEFSSNPTSGKGSITIIDDVEWIFQIYPQILILDAGSWGWDFECIDTQGNILSLYNGTIKIKQDVSYG